MNIQILLAKLIEIERSIGVETNTTLHKQVLDAQDYVLGMHKEIVERLRKEPRSLAFESLTTTRFAA